MLIKIKKVFKYEPDSNERFTCRLYLYLPADEEGYLDPMLRSPYFLMGEPLRQDWGVYDSHTFNETYRKRYEAIVSPKSWEDLEQKINKTTQTLIKALREIKEENEKNLENRPTDKIEELII